MSPDTLMMCLKRSKPATALRREWENCEFNPVAFTHAVLFCSVTVMVRPDHRPQLERTPSETTFGEKRIPLTRSPAATSPTFHRICSSPSSDAPANTRKVGSREMRMACASSPECDIQDRDGVAASPSERLRVLTRGLIVRPCTRIEKITTPNVRFKICSR